MWLHLKSGTPDSTKLSLGAYTLWEAVAVGENEHDQQGALLAFPFAHLQFTQSLKTHESNQNVHCLMHKSSAWCPEHLLFLFNDKIQHWRKYLNFLSSSIRLPKSQKVWVSSKDSDGDWEVSDHITMGNCPQFCPKTQHSDSITMIHQSNLFNLNSTEQSEETLLTFGGIAHAIMFVMWRSFVDFARIERRGGIGSTSRRTDSRASSCNTDTAIFDRGWDSRGPESASYKMWLKRQYSTTYLAEDWRDK